MAEYAYYVVVFTARSWHLFKRAGGRTAGFPIQAWSRVTKLKPGDNLICYLVDSKRWIALLRVAGEPYFDTEPPIWGAGVFPSRVPVRISVELPMEMSVEARVLVSQIPRLKEAEKKQAGAWGGFLRGSPRQWPAEDAEIVIDALSAVYHKPSDQRVASPDNTDA